MEGANSRVILQDKLLQTAEKLKPVRNLTSQQDNDPKHKDKATQQWLNDEKVDFLQWPKKSPGLTPGKLEQIYQKEWTIYLNT